MPYIKAKEYKQMKEELEKLKQLKSINTWKCVVCNNYYSSLQYLYIHRGDGSVCNVDKTSYFQRVALMTIKGLRQNYLIDNIENLILRYVFDDGSFKEELSTKPILRYMGESWEYPAEYCRDKFWNTHSR